MNVLLYLIYKEGLFLLSVYFNVLDKIDQAMLKLESDRIILNVSSI